MITSQHIKIIVYYKYNTILTVLVHKLVMYNTFFLQYFTSLIFTFFSNVLTSFKTNIIITNYTFII